MDTVLTQAELDELWTEWRASGDLGVRERLICHYLPVVDFLARRAARSVPQAHRRTSTASGSSV
jgi:DNA-directed RNA polymerase specialized sigma subunit